MNTMILPFREGIC